MEEGTGTEPEMRLAAPWKAGLAVGGITRWVSAKRFETPLVRGSRLVLAAWGSPTHPGFPPLGETGKGGF